ncbi:hypothetical protein BDR07DRAFT_1612555 [Suillus spraguei]|nr:hypothetical protein BDR07DRAFT_1612555 [Suillus spraguei]
MSSLLSVPDMVKLQAVKYANLGSLAVFVFDYCITFSEEVQCTWFKPWDATRVIFVISRYLPFAGIAMNAYDALRVSTECVSDLEGYIIHVVCIVAAEALLVIRTWAFWQKSRRLLFGLLAYATFIIAAATAAHLSSKMLIPGENPPGICYFESTHNTAIAYFFLAMFESVVLILTVYKRVRDYKDFQSDIVITLYRDNMFYMFCILAITIANVICEGALPSAYSSMFDTLQLVIHSVLASRILFRLREENKRVHVPFISLTTFDSQLNCLRPPSMSMGGTGTPNEV